jgi:hypothetical protein
VPVFNSRNMLLVLIQSDDDGWYGHGIHGKTRKKF